MKYCKFLMLVFLMIILIAACTDETNIINQTVTKKTVVIISDNSPTTDIIIRVSGEIISKHPEFDIRYIQVEPFNYIEASYIIDLTAQTLPKGSYIIGIVDPETSTKKMVFKADGKYILAPDNGLATRIFNRGNIDSIYYAENPTLIGGDVQENLSYEDFYTATVSSFLSNIPLNQFGTKVENPVKFDIYPAKFENDTLSGEISITDNFGNCVANIPDSLLTHFKVGDILKIEAGNTHFFAKYGTGYSSVNVGLNVAFKNSSKRLEISVNYGDMSSRYSISAGMKLTITKAKLKIGILKYNDSEVANNIVNFMKTELQTLGVTNESATIVEKNANGDANLLPTLINELLNEKIDILVPVSTPASQSAVFNTPETIPIVFTYVTDPESAGILNKRNGVTGCSDATNFADYIRFVKRLLPNLEIAGHIYNDKESNASYAKQQLATLAPFYNLTLKSEIANSTDQIATAFQNIKNQSINTILIAADNTMSKGITNLSALSVENKMVLIGDSNEHSQGGALASISVDYEKLSKSTGNLIYSVLLGKNPDNEDIRKFSTDVISVNKTTANKIGFTIPIEIINEAKFVYEK
ncbi:MAG TPA: SAM-dependent chlorinase/fluorinase [Candidatus Kapabacteria bacterium]|nr:SAM-dependent chlorinase/fluorinase [Candidatus Kapabacteria bacterium]